MAPGSELANNASNLATVLHYLDNDKPYDFEQFKRLVHEVFPHIKQIRVPPIDTPTVRIYIGTVEPEKRHEDLDIPLAAKSTGIGQVLAMLYVVFTAEFPRIIVIDEPQSFLHPGAIYRLFNILNAHR
jgi:predicted ATPase